MSVVERLKSKSEEQELIWKVESKIQQVILGKEAQIRLCLCSILAGGHLLIEDIPGMGKTTLVKTLAKLFGFDFRRIQFTNDLLPADILGSTIFDEGKKEFVFHRGPIFGQLVLADEVNRATPKTQSACLQAMEEFQVSIDGVSYELGKPFFLIATQNPKQNIGTFPLPESQLDRFLMKISLGFPDRQAEKTLLMGHSRQSIIDDLPVLMSPEEVLALQHKVSRVRVTESIIEYLQNIVDASRIKYQGLSPRAALGIKKAAQAWAFISGRDFVVPEDIHAVGIATMNHRLATTDDPYGSHGVKRAEQIIASVPVS